MTRRDSPALPLLSSTICAGTSMSSCTAGSVLSSAGQGHNKGHGDLWPSQVTLGDMAGDDNPETHSGFFNWEIIKSQGFLCLGPLRGATRLGCYEVI